MVQNFRDLEHFNVNFFLDILQKAVHEVYQTLFTCQELPDEFPSTLKCVVNKMHITMGSLMELLLSKLQTCKPQRLALCALKPLR